MARWRIAALGVGAVLLALAVATIGPSLTGGVASRASTAAEPTTLPTARPTASLRPSPSPGKTPMPTELQASAPPLPPPTPGVLGDIRVATPDGWVVQTEKTRLVLNSTGSGFFSIEQLVIALEPGADLSIKRPTGSSQTASFTVSGRTFDELVASIDAAVPDATRTKTTIDGRMAYRWGIPQTWYIGPLNAMGAIEWKGTFYVFVQHLPLDGAPGDTLGILLGAVTLE